MIPCSTTVVAASLYAPIISVKQALQHAGKIPVNAMGFIKNGTDKYYYIRNLQNDVVGVLDSSGTQVVEYVYDTWGKLESVTGAMAETIGRENPLRYRGYYYDEETGFYYVSSRYYDPVVGRFINADTSEVLTASPDKPNWNKNLFAYCDNDPVNRVDEDGEFWNFIAGAAIGALSVYVGDVIQNVAAGKTGWDILKPTSSVGTYLGAAASGMVPGTGVLSVIARPIISTGVKYGVDGGILKKDVHLADVGKDLAVNVAGEFLSLGVNKAINSARPQNYSSFRHQMTRRIPAITQQQTRELMYSVHRALTALIKVSEFVISSITSR